jgi:uncharacterized protein (TIGR02391 family)
VRQMLRREMLHSDLQGAVYDNFATGNYDLSILDAFVQVEIAVRDAAKLPATLVGVKLMREAFNPNTGKLTEMALPISERERMADLFVGAAGTFKNPLSHRKVGNADPARHCHTEQVEAVFDRGEARLRHCNRLALSGKTVEASKTR